MVTFMLMASAVLILVTFWPHAQAPVGAVSLAGALFVAAPLGWLLSQSPVTAAGWLLLAFVAMVLGRWLLEKWQAQ